jgi:hypothetical protein
MPFNALLLPLLGGYILICFTHLFAYYSSRQSKEHLLFHSLLAGVVLGALGRLMAFALSTVEFFKSASAAFKQVFPFEFLGSSLLSLLLGISLTVAINIIVPKRRATHFLYKRQVLNSFEALIYESLGLDDDAVSAKKTKLLLFTLADGKVYVAIPRWFPRLTRNDDAYIRITPFISGYRMKDTQELVLTTRYTEIYKKELQQAGKKDEIDFKDFDKILRLSDIKGISVFNERIFQGFKKIVPSTTKLDNIKRKLRT